MTRCAGTCRWNVANIIADDPKGDVSLSSSQSMEQNFTKNTHEKTKLNQSKKKHARRKTELDVTLSEALLQYRSEKDIKDTLLHEMIHAWLFLTKGRFHGNHGDHFQQKMREINQKESANISIFHSFHAEVQNFQTHWWECEKCRKIITRAMNRAPSKHDFWWSQHMAACGGTFFKIREPAPKPVKAAMKGKAKKRKREEGQQDLLKMFKKVKRVNDRDLGQGAKETPKMGSLEMKATADSPKDAPISVDIHNTMLVPCPVCFTQVCIESINEHLDNCMKQHASEIVDVDVMFPSSDFPPKSNMQPLPERSVCPQITLEKVDSALASLMQLVDQKEDGPGEQSLQLNTHPTGRAPLVDIEQLSPWETFTLGQQHTPVPPDDGIIMQLVTSVQGKEEVRNLFITEYRRLVAEREREEKKQQELDKQRKKEAMKAALLEKEMQKSEKEAHNLSAVESNLIHRDVATLPPALGTPPLKTLPKSKLNFGNSPPPKPLALKKKASKPPYLPPQSTRTAQPQQEAKNPGYSDPGFLDFVKQIGSEKVCYLCGDDLKALSDRILLEHYNDCICSML
eukprot:CAMPEP_0117436982 /NCGR_PEP_ID=MMETSP0759-20121206/1288_1 /TAXON_ID=63605 /ORGANISM="Percolomonas cosmopolitus, Strain WS" /LENGTH=568 /DNA_ID=CAMNT_0005228599 /DNA_START=137 /DNA_END=1844 /DNA_ORIENTATION=+